MRRWTAWCARLRCFPKLPGRHPPSLKQRENLPIRAVRVSHTAQLATHAHVLSGTAQYRTCARLVCIKFPGRRRVIGNAQSDNLILTITEGKRQKRCAPLQVWVGVSRKLDQRL